MSESTEVARVVVTGGPQHGKTHAMQQFAQQYESPPLGAKVFVRNEVRPYTVRARNDRYAVCTKPFNLKKTTLYCILDAQRGWRAPEGLVFGLGAETDEHCEQMLERVTTGETELSRRHGVDWDVVLVVPAPTPKGAAHVE